VAVGDRARQHPWGCLRAHDRQTGSPGADLLSCGYDPLPQH